MQLLPARRLKHRKMQMLLSLHGSCGKSIEWNGLRLIDVPKQGNLVQRPRLPAAAAVCLLVGWQHLPEPLGQGKRRKLVQLHWVLMPRCLLRPPKAWNPLLRLLEKTQRMLMVPQALRPLENGRTPRESSLWLPLLPEACIGIRIHKTSLPFVDSQGTSNAARHERPRSWRVLAEAGPDKAGQSACFVSGFVVQGSSQRRMSIQLPLYFKLLHMIKERKRDSFSWRCQRQLTLLRANVLRLLMRLKSLKGFHEDARFRQM